jgi:hypothetical protein
MLNTATIRHCVYKAWKHALHMHWIYRGFGAEASNSKRLCTLCAPVDSEATDFYKHASLFCHQSFLFQIPVDVSNSQYAEAYDGLQGKVSKFHRRTHYACEEDTPDCDEDSDSKSIALRVRRTSWNNQ